jgi:hypothetical protein
VEGAGPQLLVVVEARQSVSGAAGEPNCHPVHQVAIWCRMASLPASVAASGCVIGDFGMRQVMVVSGAEVEKPDDQKPDDQTTQMVMGGVERRRGELNLDRAMPNRQAVASFLMELP